MINQQQLINLIPLACEWVKEQEQFILNKGIPLSDKQLFIASKIGIKNVTKIRLLKVDFIPEPTNQLLNMACKSIGLISSSTLGITFQYGIYIQKESWENEQLLLHELTHTLQYERLGGISNFLNQYIKECVYFGYEKSKLEIEARNMETRLEEILYQFLK
jgi:hypothetical protein